MMAPSNQPLLMRHINGENLGRFPVWMMRQAGRYLESYRKIREKHTFWEMATIPELAAEVSLLPLEVLKVDAVIFFSDILTLPYALGIPIEMRESVGPVVTKPLTDLSAFQVFRDFTPAEHAPYVGKAQESIRKILPSEIALLGFAGAPWTVASYLIEGKPDRHFTEIKKWMHRDPKGLSDSLTLLADATVKHLKYQFASGCHMVQLFDTWANEIPTWFFRDYYQPILKGMFQSLKETNVPSIYFAKGAHHLIGELETLGSTGLSVDSLMALPEAERKIGTRCFLQGNLDPILLKTGDLPTIRRETRKLVMEARQLSRPAILNLGHGILPKTPVENAVCFVNEARALWL